MIICGKIERGVGEVIVSSFIPERFEEYFSVRTAIKDKKFRLEFYISKPRQLRLDVEEINHEYPVGTGNSILFVEPGDSLYVTGTAKNWISTVRFSGKGTANTNFYNEFKKLNPGSYWSSTQKDRERADKFRRELNKRYKNATIVVERRGYKGVHVSNPGWSNKDVLVDKQYFQNLSFLINEKGEFSGDIFYTLPQTDRITYCVNELLKKK